MTNSTSTLYTLQLALYTVHNIHYNPMYIMLILTARICRCALCVTFTTNSTSTLYTLHSTLTQHTLQHHTDGLVPITLGGDHHITNPLVRAVASHAQQPISIIQFDAHNDLYEDYEGDPYSHASPFARILERGPRECCKLVQLGIRTATDHNREQVRQQTLHTLTYYII
jgi:arginase family enzyme